MMTSDRDDAEPSCPRCGTGSTWEECEQCGGDGFFEVDDDPDYMPYFQDCGACAQQGGWWRCAATYEWCQNNPLPGQEQTRRDA